MRKLYMAIPMLLLATPVMAQTEQPADCIRFENIRSKQVPDKNPDWVDVAWKVDVISECTTAELTFFNIEFLDAEGFQVEMTVDITWIEPGQTKTSRGRQDIEKHKADRIATVIASR